MAQRTVSIDHLRDDVIVVTWKHLWVYPGRVCIIVYRAGPCLDPFAFVPPQCFDCTREAQLDGLGVCLLTMIAGILA